MALCDSESGHGPRKVCVIFVRCCEKHDLTRTHRQREVFLYTLFFCFLFTIAYSVVYFTIHQTQRIESRGLPRFWFTVHCRPTTDAHSTVTVKTRASPVEKL